VEHFCLPRKCPQLCQPPFLGHPRCSQVDARRPQMSSLCFSGHSCGACLIRRIQRTCPRTHSPVGCRWIGILRRHKSQGSNTSTLTTNFVNIKLCIYFSLQSFYMSPFSVSIYINHTLTPYDDDGGPTRHFFLFLRPGRRCTNSGWTVTCSIPRAFKTWVSSILF
jgi:hypothetical protein